MPLSHLKTAHKSQHPLLQLIRFGLVGVMNTLLTLAVIYMCKSWFGVNPYLSNAIGYVAGVINSFLWSKNWVFRSGGRFTHEAVKFFVGFGVCYLLQLLVVWVLNTSPLGAFEFVVAGLTFSGYGIATIVGNVVYTLCNFSFNRLVTFRKKA